MSNISINCSPEALKVLQENPQMIQKLLGAVNMPNKSDTVKSTVTETATFPVRGDHCDENAENAEAMQKETVEDSVDQGGEIIDNGGVDADRAIWVDGAVKLLLSLVSDLRSKVGKSFHLKTKKKMWERVEMSMKSAGHNFSASQIENKYRGLVRTYKATKSHNNKSGRNRETCPYEKELSDLLRGCPSIYPRCVVGAATNEVVTHEDILGSSIRTIVEESQVEPSCSTADGLLCLPDEDGAAESTATAQQSELARRKRSNHQQIMDEFRKLRTEKALMRSTIEKSAERREDLLKEKNNILRERNAILRELVEVIKNKQ